MRVVVIHTPTPTHTHAFVLDSPLYILHSTFSILQDVEKDAKSAHPFRFLGEECVL